MVESRGLWRPITECPMDGFFLVHEDGAVRTMFRSHGEWQATAVAVDEHGNSLDGPTVRVRETGVYEPKHFIPIEHFLPVVTFDDDRG
jgi:hypothetical protein